MRTITDIADAVRRDERITTADALKLWREAPSVSYTHLTLPTILLV